MQSPAATAASAKRHPIPVSQLRWGHHLGAEDPYRLCGNCGNGQSPSSHYVPDVAVSALGHLHNLLLEVRITACFIVPNAETETEKSGRTAQVDGELVSRGEPEYKPRTPLSLQNPHSSPQALWSFRKEITMQKIPCLCFQEETSYMYAKIMNRRIQKMIDGKLRNTVVGIGPGKRGKEE